MGNRTSFYFGAYLKIKVSKTIEVHSANRVCLDGHGLQGKYCAQCGKASEQQPARMDYPTGIHDLLDERWEDVLSAITPPKLFQTGVILAIGNAGSYLEDNWMHITPDDYDYPELKPFPASFEIVAMEKALAANYASIIDALKQSKHVVSVSVKSGYVLDQEF